MPRPPSIGRTAPVYEIDEVWVPRRVRDVGGESGGSELLFSAAELILSRAQNG
ncbi:hypothetical protein G3I77_03195 [Streptomyces sp. D2-8]|uniref:hypothetical protein n=1 Tax=Streptomyces sp. D2-8 TaxID=2707767 RepID=UPI0020C14A22|nr:hypothetical protein [Streptomyces sp. D2-8]MCK8432065.1 hypothetical protein [Streptomyces sp. D2-8]